MASWTHQFKFGLFLLTGGWFRFGLDPVSQYLDQIQRLVRRRFSEVPHISSDRLQEWLETEGALRPLLLDCRRYSEYRVSHLPGALHAGTSVSRSHLGSFLETGRPIVVYCSVGYRSARVGRALLSMGAPSVSNLEGSIFRWANEGRPLVCDHGSTHQVHPYGLGFGCLLKQEARTGK